eukprot:CAMPEP_0175067698 /NCGR_PEP_ID=MMETSP0052_2-20121109/17249_1 /TAXON_ID=51329 ORGANISM="Polytomella parva, Strain SAG 63-3" /NCGR_SAMPLE_ID=MMETSP0052_2 /ASSEMBLY_ACC=CAM_ASM_000194 /LENGTH=388 /DNA_ID=CAMNT_0016334621 /DNA_START=335 /DNA_END=1497 /DNA_ORIENTATION=+
MQVGFVSLEVGYGRAKNVRNVLLKNMADVMLCAICWWSVGFGIGNGKSRGGFVGSNGFFSDGLGSINKPWFYSYVFAITTVTIASGCLAERTDLLAYPIYTFFMSTVVHPFAVHWAWNNGSWLHTVFLHGDCVFLDFAGGAVVHVCGGLMGLIGAWLCGPRLGRFEQGQPKEMVGHDVSSVALGTFFLWFGWYGFNCGSTYLYFNASPAVSDRVALNMTLCAATSGLTALLLSSLRTHTLDVCVCCNGLLGGLVAATPSCAYVTSFASVVIGLAAGGTYLGLAKWILEDLRIDDPLESAAIHCGCGMVGVLAVGLLGKQPYIALLTGAAGCRGLFYGRGTSNVGLLLGVQVVGLLVITLWTAFFAMVCFGALKYAGRLRVDQMTELAG